MRFTYTPAPMIPPTAPPSKSAGIPVERTAFRICISHQEKYPIYKRGSAANHSKIAQDSYRHIHWNAVFTSKQINFNGHTVGLELTMYADSPYAYLDEVVHEFHFDTHDIHDSSNLLRKHFQSLAQAEGYTYPDLEIRILDEGNNNGKLTLWLNNRKSEIKGCKTQELITIKGQQQVICTSDSNHDIARDFNFIFPRIERGYQEHTNYLSADLACDITLKYFPVILTGL